MTLNWGMDVFNQRRVPLNRIKKVYPLKLPPSFRGHRNYISLRKFLFIVNNNWRPYVLKVWKHVRWILFLLPFGNRIMLAFQIRPQKFRLANKPRVTYFCYRWKTMVNFAHEFNLRRHVLSWVHYSYVDQWLVKKKSGRPVQVG